MKFETETIRCNQVNIALAFEEDFENVLEEFACSYGEKYSDIADKIISGTMDADYIEKLCEQVEYNFEDGWNGQIRISKEDIPVPDSFGDSTVNELIDTFKKIGFKNDRDILDSIDYAFLSGEDSRGLTVKDISFEKVRVEGYYVYGIGVPH